MAGLNRVQLIGYLGGDPETRQTPPELHRSVGAPGRFVAGARTSPVPSEFECGAPTCTFLIRTEDPDEIVEHVRLHAREKHDKAIDEARVRDRIRSV